jgi:hypothetical protein
MLSKKRPEFPMAVSRPRRHLRRPTYHLGLEVGSQLRLDHDTFAGC